LTQSLLRHPDYREGRGPLDALQQPRTDQPRHLDRHRVHPPTGTEREVTGGPPTVGVGKQLLLYGGELPFADRDRRRTRARTLTVRAYRVGQGGEGGEFAVGVLEQADRPLAHRDGGERLGPGVAFAGVHPAGDDREDGVP
jgi:hypothetical protein